MTGTDEQPIRYEITVTGHAGHLLESALDGFTVVRTEPDRVHLAGAVVDQAALHGALRRLQDLRVDVVDVHRVREP